MHYHPLLQRLFTLGCISCAALYCYTASAADQFSDSQGYQVAAGSYSYGPYDNNISSQDNVKNTAVQSVPFTFNNPLQITDNTVELQVHGNYDYSPSNDVQGGAGYGLDTTIYSQTINNNWRIFAGEYFAHENEPADEGNISLWRSMAGVEYHDSAFKISAAPTYNYYNGVNGDSRVGGVGDVAWTINDAWSLAADAQLFSRDVPLRALNDGVTANSYDVNASWHQGEQRSFRLDDEVMTFSDDNVRNSINGVYTERLYAYGDTFTLDGLINATESNDTLDENRLYYNPKMDATGSAGLQATQVLYRDGDNVYRQSLQILPGDYWQENYGGSFALSGRYEVRASLGSAFDMGVGAAYAHQAADGTISNDVTVLFDLTKRL